MCFGLLSTHSTFRLHTQIYIYFWLIIPKPVYLITVQGQVWTIRFWRVWDTVGTLWFNPECCELAHLFGHMSKLHKNLTCECPRNSTGPCSSSIEDAFQIKIVVGRQLGCGGCGIWQVSESSNNHKPQDRSFLKRGKGHVWRCRVLCIHLHRSHKHHFQHLWHK